MKIIRIFLSSVRALHGQVFHFAILIFIQIPFTLIGIVLSDADQEQLWISRFLNFKIDRNRNQLSKKSLSVFIDWIYSIEWSSLLNSQHIEAKSNRLKWPRKFSALICDLTNDMFFKSKPNICLPIVSSSGCSCVNQGKKDQSTHNRTGQIFTIPIQSELDVSCWTEKKQPIPFRCNL